MKTIAIANQKGGTGKTTTTYNLGIALTQQGYRVLMVDFDPQGNLSCYCGITPEKDLDQTITELLMKTSCEKPIGNRECVYQTGRKEAAARVDFIPSNLRLAGFELAMGTMMCREVLLKSCLELYNNQYDYSKTYAATAHNLQVCHTDKSVWLEYASKPLAQRETFYKQNEAAPQAYSRAASQLDGMGISQDIELEKVKQLVSKTESRISDLIGKLEKVRESNHSIQRDKEKVERIQGSS